LNSCQNTSLHFTYFTSLHFTYFKLLYTHKKPAEASAEPSPQIISIFRFYSENQKSPQKKEADYCLFVAGAGATYILRRQVGQLGLVLTGALSSI
jgi:hypothetical protein